MKTIILNKLTLAGFKGASETFDFNPDKNAYSGKNGTGKTRMFDADCWLRTGKDSLGKADFEIKTLENGEPIHNAEHSVTGVYSCGSKTLELGRKFQEKWRKPRGKLEQVFDGHETIYSVDGKTVTKKNYEIAVAAFFPENYRLVTEPKYFPTMPWKDRRVILAGMSGEIDTEAIFKQVEGLKELLDGKSAEDRRDICKERRKQINKELQDIPAKIEEHQTIIAGAGVVGITENAIKEAEREVKRAELAVKNAESGNNPGAVEELKKLNAALLKEESKLAQAKRTAQQAEADRQSHINHLMNNIKSYKLSLSGQNTGVEALRAEYKKIFNSAYDGSDTCPHCKQSLPDEMIETAENDFNLKKSKDLEVNKNNGKAAVAKRQEIEQMIIDAKEEKAELELLKPDAILQLEETPEIEELKAEISKTEDATISQEIDQRLYTDIETAKNELKRCQETQAAINQTEGSKARVEELQSKVETLSNEFNQLEKILYLIDRFEELLATETEAAVNQLFDIVSFRMFRKQINGGLEQCCDIVINGSPYETAASNGERIKGELDIIRTMSKHFELSGPVFIDNRESITGDINMDCQTIELSADDNFEILTKR